MRSSEAAVPKICTAQHRAEIFAHLRSCTARLHVMPIPLFEPVSERTFDNFSESSKFAQPSFRSQAAWRKPKGRERHSWWLAQPSKEAMILYVQTSASMTRRTPSHSAHDAGWIACK